MKKFVGQLFSTGGELPVSIEVNDRFGVEVVNELLYFIQRFTGKRHRWD